MHRTTAPWIVVAWIAMGGLPTAAAQDPASFVRVLGQWDDEDQSFSDIWGFRSG